MISVIMPAYNSGRYIASAIASVLSQDHDDLELLVVDNNSTDDTVQIIRSFGDPRVRLLRQTVQGVSAARNKALEVMRGEFFCFLDADDIMPPGSICARFGLLQQHEDIHFVDGTVQVMDARLEAVTSTWKPTYEGVPYLPLLALSPSCFFASTWMIRRIPGRQYRFDESLTHAEDLLFLLSIARDGRYTSTPEVVLRYRKGHVSAMKDLSGLHNGYRGLVRAIEDFIDPPDTVVLDTMWDRIRRIMWRSYFKRGQFIRSLMAFLEPRPTAQR